MYTVTKTYGHNLGLSCCFRQPLAVHSHCKQLHGYAIAVEIEFMSHELDENHWVIDFGSLKPVKEWLTYVFDHTTLIAAYDPEMDKFVELNDSGIIDLRIMEAVGCEEFAKAIYEWIADWLQMNEDNLDRVMVTKVTVREHGANAASYSEA